MSWGNWREEGVLGRRKKNSHGGGEEMAGGEFESRINQ